MQPEFVPTVRINDYAEPIFSVEVDAIRESVSDFAAQLRLESEPMLEQASAETGLDDYGDEGFRARLDIILGSLIKEAGLSPFGVLSNHTFLLGLLKNRLQIESLIAKHPEISEIPIDRPIFIVGLPRTGTTHLHNLISSDSSLRSLPYWESLEPVLPESERLITPDPRYARTQVAVDWIDAAMPLFKRMHDMTVNHVHEEIQLLAIDFSSMLFESMAHLPSVRDDYLARDQTPHYEYLTKILQVLNWLDARKAESAGEPPRPARRWLLKSPQHGEQLKVLARVFPDASFVVTHRDPVAVTTSVATMVTYGARMSVANPDPIVYGRYWSDRVEDLLRGVATDRDLLPDSRTIDVCFDDFMRDDVAMVKRVFEVCDQPFSPSAEVAMHAFMERHPRGRHGTVVYTLEDFGVDPDERRKALAFYSDKFGVGRSA